MAFKPQLNLDEPGIGLEEVLKSYQLIIVKNPEKDKYYTCTVCKTDLKVTKAANLVAHLKGSNHLKKQRAFVKNISPNLNNILEKYPQMFARVDENHIRCVTCKRELGGSNHNMEDHFKTDHHLKAIDMLARRKVIDAMSEKEFNKWYVMSSIASGLSITQMVNTKGIVEATAGRVIPEKTTLQDIRKEIANETQENVYALIRPKKVCIMMDETTDGARRSIAGVMVQTLEPNGPNKTYFLGFTEMEGIKSDNILKLLNDTVHKIWPDGISFVTFCIFYMIN